MRTIIFTVSSIAFIFLGITANIIGIGYFLYLWGATSLAIGTAMWTAFILWLKLVVSAFICGIIALTTKV